MPWPMLWGRCSGSRARCRPTVSRSTEAVARAEVRGPASLCANAWFAALKCSAPSVVSGEKPETDARGEGEPDEIRVVPPGDIFQLWTAPSELRPVPWLCRSAHSASWHSGDRIVPDPFVPLPRSPGARCHLRPRPDLRPLAPSRRCGPRRWRARSITTRVKSRGPR